MPGSGDIRILAAPAEALALRHGFDAAAAPLAARIATRGPLTVQFGHGAPLAVDMRMLLAAARRLPVCLSLCERICARSDYRVAVTLFDRPLVSIRVRGLTSIGPEGDTTEGT